MRIYKLITDKVLVEDKLVNISSIDKNDSIRDLEVSGVVNNIVTYITEPMYIYKTPIGNIYTSSVDTKLINKHSELSSDVILVNSESVGIGDYLCLGSNPFYLKEDNNKLNLYPYLLGGRDTIGINPLVESIGIPRPVLFKAMRYDLPSDHPHFARLEYYLNKNGFKNTRALTEHVLNTYSHPIEKPNTTINKYIIDLCFIYYTNGYKFEDGKVLVDITIIPTSNIEEYLNKLSIPSYIIGKYLYVDSLMFFKLFKDDFNHMNFLPNVNSKLSRKLTNLITDTNTTFLVGSQQALANLQYLLYINNILSYIDCDEYGTYTLQLVENSIHIPSHGFLVPILNIERQDSSSFYSLGITPL